MSYILYDKLSRGKGKTRYPKDSHWKIQPWISFDNITILPFIISFPHDAQSHYLIKTLVSGYLSIISNVQSEAKF